MTPEQEAAEGTRAEYLLTELQPYFDALRLAIISQWENSPIRDKEGQNELRLMRKLLSDLEANIKTVIDTGKMARVQIQKESVLSKIKSKF